MSSYMDLLSNQIFTHNPRGLNLHNPHESLCCNDIMEVNHLSKPINLAPDFIAECFSGMRD